MIQRVQSIYLFLATVATIILLFMPIANLYTNDYGFVFTPFVVKDITPEPGIISSTLYIAIALIICAILSFVTIFLYKKRERQIKVIYATMILFLFAILLMFYIYPNIILPKIPILQDGYTIEYNKFTLLCLIPIALFLFLANRAIKNDEKKVRAADRLR